MKKSELVEKGAVYIENIQNGFEDYTYEVISMGKEEAQKLFSNLKEKNGIENSFLDFYYFAIRDEERACIDEILSPEQIQYLREYKETKLAGDAKEEIIFPMEDTLLEIAVELNEASALFFHYVLCKREKHMVGEL